MKKIMKIFVAMVMATLFITLQSLSVLMSVTTVKNLCRPETYLDHSWNDHPICDINVHYDVVVFINSASKHLDRRKAIRETWGNETVYLSKGYRFKIFFLVGNAEPTDAALKKQLEQEKRNHRDVLYVDIVDRYKNNIYKHMYGLNAVAKYCSNVDLVVKTDDDVFVDVIGVYLYVTNSEVHKSTIWCVHTQHTPNRNPTAKWFVDKRTYSKDFPRFCYGAFYTLNITAVRILRDKVYCSFLFWVDDALITGHMRSQTDIQLTMLNRSEGVFYPQNFYGKKIRQIVNEGNIKMVYIDAVSTELMYLFWEIIKKKWGL